MPRLVLGSSSPHRRLLLERLHVPFDTDAPDVDEDAVEHGDLPADEIAAELARRKARTVADRHPDAVVIGSDQAVVCDGRLLGKPGAHEACVRQLRWLRGREHRLVTAVCLTHGDAVTEFADVTRMRMRELTDDEIERYVTAERPFDCCGGYRIEGLGIALFERIDSDDHSAIVGLPLLRLCRELRRLGISLP